MRRGKAISLGNAIQNYLQTTGLDHKLRDVQLINAWEQITGKFIANATKKVFIHHAMYVVEVESAVIRNELMYKKSDLLNQLNAIAGSEYLKEIVIK